MKRVLIYKGTEYYLLSELLKTHPGHNHICERQDLKGLPFVFYKKKYITAEAWNKIEMLINADEEYYSKTQVVERFMYKAHDAERVIFKILRDHVTTMTIDGNEYYLRADVDRFATIGQLYTDVFGIDVVTGSELVAYHNAPENRLYHKGNLYISCFHLQFLYERERQIKLNGIPCLIITEADPFEEFARRCRESTEIDYFENYFGKVSRNTGTYKIMKDFYIETVNGSNSSNRERMATYFLEKLHYLFSSLQKEIYLYSSGEINEKVFGDPNLNGVKEIVHFINYVKERDAGFLPDVQKYEMRASNKRTDYVELLYSEEEFAEIYHEAINVERHVENAYNDSAYAQYWLFILLQLSNFARTSDITNLPLIEMHKDFPWKCFCEEEIDESDARLICDLYEITARNQLIGKNKEQKKIYFLAEQIPAVATSIVICSGHARKRKLNSLFSFRSINAERVYNKLGEPFCGIQNRKMNYTLATFFEAMGDGDGSYRNNVYRLLSIMRGHRRRTPLSLSETTCIYIKETNKDPAPSIAAYHAFQRGAFGWLYHILLELSNEGFENAVEETKRISELQGRYLPEDLEEISDFVRHESEERKEILRILPNVGSLKLRQFLENLGTVGTFKRYAELPCLFGRNCPRPGANCVYCGFSIKTVHSVYIYREEIRTVMEMLENTSDEIVAKKNVFLLYKILLVLKDFRQEFGNEYMKAFIDMDDIKRRMMDLPAGTLQMLSEVRRDERIT